MLNDDDLPAGVNDGHLSAAEFDQAAADVAHGVCSLCDQALDPLDPRWAGSYTAAYPAAVAAELAGPAHPTQPFDVRCLETRREDLADHQPTRPALRPPGTGPTPPGWQTVPAGRNHRSEDLEVVYDPRRYDVLVVHGEAGGAFPRLEHEERAYSPELMLDALGVSGWESYNWATRGPRVWIRDREAAEQLAFEHHEAGWQPEVRFDDVGPTRPFVRTAGPDVEPIPPGWIAEPAGETRGRPVEVVYNPRRHEVMSLRPARRCEALLDALAAQGWELGHSDNSSDLYWRDRVARAQRVLERTETEPIAEIEGRGR